MNMHLSADHEHIDIAQLSAKIETSPTTDEDSTAIAQCADSLANVETGCADVEIAEIRSGVVTVEPKHGRNTGDVAGIISDEENDKTGKKKISLSYLMHQLYQKVMAISLRDCFDISIEIEGHEERTIITIALHSLPVNPLSFLLRKYSNFCYITISDHFLPHPIT